MEQNNAVNGQGEAPENNQPVEKQTTERPTQENASMESLLEEQGLSLDFPQVGEIRTGFIATSSMSRCWPTTPSTSCSSASSDI